MKILKNWTEIGDSINNLKKAGLQLHSEPVKCWDFNNIREILLERDRDKNARIVDLGCGPSSYGCLTMEFLRSIGYKNLVGIDLHIPFYSRVITLIRGWTKYRTLRPYQMKSADILSTGLKSKTVDVAILLSVVEHGVDFEGMFRELNRIMKIGGIIYISTDYWDDKIIDAPKFAKSGAHDNTQLPWQIFDRDSIQKFIALSANHGFQVVGRRDMPYCEERPVFWNNVFYTFIAMVFEKVE